MIIYGVNLHGTYNWGALAEIIPKWPQLAETASWLGAELESK